MITTTHVSFPVRDVASLHWQDNYLIDWVCGQRHDLDGRQTNVSGNFSAHCDAAAVSPSGAYALLYSRLGIKGLLLHHGELIREISRSDYCCHHYEYPAALLRLRDGREVIVHCPDEYCRLEIDELASGKRLTASPNRKPTDFFHSRLSASPDGRFLASAGWVWHPVDKVGVFDLALALVNPCQLDDEGRAELWSDYSSASWVDSQWLMTVMEPYVDEPPNPIAFRLENLITRAVITHPSPITPVGSIVAIDQRHVLSLYLHPKLLDLKEQCVLQEWPDIPSGLQRSSIVHPAEFPPPMAYDPIRRRFAIADQNHIHILQFVE